MAARRRSAPGAEGLTPYYSLRTIDQGLGALAQIGRNIDAPIPRRLHANPGRLAVALEARRLDRRALPPPAPRQPGGKEAQS